MSISKGEEILLVGLHQVAQKLGDVHSERHEIIDRAGRLIDATLNMYEKEGLGKPAVQWNPAVYDQSKPKEWFDDEFKAFHPAVRGTTYMEVHELLGTSGCSPEEPYWVWSALGVIETKRGRQVVCPNDWILEPYEGIFIVVPDSVYRSSQKEPASGDKS